MKRGQAEEMLDCIRVSLARGMTATTLEALLTRKYGIAPLQPCAGEAHRNLHIDYCTTCAPRWGIIGPRIKIT